MKPIHGLLFVVEERRFKSSSSWHINNTHNDSYQMNHENIANADLYYRRWGMAQKRRVCFFISSEDDKCVSIFVAHITVSDSWAWWRLLHNAELTRRRRKPSEDGLYNEYRWEGLWDLMTIMHRHIRQTKHPYCMSSITIRWRNPYFGILR